MTTLVRDVMTQDPVTCPGDTSVTDAAKLMRDRDIGTVLVTDGQALKGIVTDRDIVVRCVAAGKIADATLADACSPAMTTIPPDMSAEEAARVMAEQAVRRLPVVDKGRPVGVVSLGDLAVERDPGSVLGGISAAPPNS
jgi:CBS domain-containing protein